MTVLSHLAALAEPRPTLPEYRQIELYTKKKTLAFAEPVLQADEAVQKAVARCCLSFMALQTSLEGADPGLEGKTGWQTYLSLPRSTMIAKLVAEIYRILRVLRAIAIHPAGHLAVEDGIVKLNGAIHQVALSLEITQAGLSLLDSAVAYWLCFQDQPYPEAYGEAMLGQSFADIVGEVRRFADEDRVLYQFRQKFPFNRHFRFDCDNPRFTLDGALCRFDLGERYGSYPIDLFVVIDNTLHIIPVEALTGLALPLAELPRWRARTRDDLTLPAHFRSRFGREVVVVGQPMT